MGFNVHGKYEIETRGEVFIIRLYQSWNEECAADFFTVYKALVLEKNFMQYGVLSDFRKFEGATPQTLGYFEDIIQWAMAHGQIARAQIVNSIFKEYMVNKPTQGKIIFPVHTFKDEAPALAWLESQGLVVT